MWLVVLVPAWLLGIWLGAQVTLALDVAGSLALLLVGGLLIGGRGRGLRLVLLGGLCLLAGGVRYHLAQPRPTPESVWLLAERGPVLLEGYVVQEPRRTAATQQVVIETTAARHADSDQPAARVQGRVLLVVPPYPAYQYGQRLLVRGLLSTPPTARQPEQFSYRDYLARQQIFVLMREPELEALVGFTGNPVLLALLQLRQQLQQQIQRGLPEPQAGVATGMLLGIKTAVPEPTYRTYQQSGVAHLLVISGWHLSLVAALFVLLTRVLGWRGWRQFGLVLVGIWLYAVFVGASGSVLRAALMASLVALAAATGRSATGWLSLAASCFVLTLFNPMLVWDVGLQLSVVATVGLLSTGLAQVIPLAQRDPPPLPPALATSLSGGRELITLTLAAQVYTAPLLVYHFGNVSLIAPLANLLIGPIVGLSMGIGAGALLLSSLATLVAGVPLFGSGMAGLAQLGWLVAWLPFAYQTRIAAGLAQLEWATLQLADLAAWQVLLAYAVLAAWSSWRIRRLAGAEPIALPTLERGA